MSSATASDRIGSIGIQPVAMITPPAMIAARDPSRSPITWIIAPRALSDPDARDSSHAQAMLIVNPAMAMPSTIVPTTGVGSSSLRTASMAIAATTASIAIALTNAARTSARP